MRKRNKIIIAIVLILAVVIFLTSNKKEEAKYSSIKVSRGEVLQTVSATGAAEAKKKIDLKFANSGQIASINAKTGDTVQKGAVLAKLDTAKLDSQLAQTQASLQTAQANLRVLLDGATAQEIKVYETAVQNAESALASANSVATNDVNSAQASVSSSEVSLQNANTNLANVKNSNENSLNNVYEDSWNSVNSILIDCEEALNTNDSVLENDDAQDTLSAMNSSYLINANVSKVKAQNSYEVAQDFKNSLSSDPNYSDIEQAIFKTKVALSDTKVTLSDAYSVLQATITSSALTQSELDALKTSISSERTSINTAISNLTTKEQGISTQKVANQTSLDSATASVNSAASALAVARNNLTSVTSSSQNTIIAREGDLQRAKDQLEQIKAGPSAAQRLSSQSQVNQAIASVDLIKKQIEDSSVVAPYDGIVTSVEGEVGETVSSAEVFISMMIPNGFEIKANISEVDISKLKIGDEVEITFDALGSDQIFKGEVSEIDPAETEVSGVIYYKVMTIFTADSAVIKPGMTANLDIMTAKRENVVKIPFQALKEKDDGYKYVQVVDDKGVISEVGVKVGLKGDVDLEITEGLSEGQKVITFIEE
jgi:HlyD family secretion protein